MPSKKKKFIDKKNAVTFTVVHRSQKDPKAADDEAPQRVLLSSQQEEQLKYGIEFEDDYDYLQHLKDVNELNNVETETFRIGRSSSDILLQLNENKPRLLLPSVVFASDVETTVGLLNKNISLIGPQPDLDPDILAALDGEVLSDEELDDNFVTFANAMDEEIKSDDDDDLSSDDTIGSLNTSDDDDKRSRFTGMSMTSSVIRRNQNLQLVDAKFEKFYEKFKNDEDDSDIENVDDDYDNSQNDDILHQLIGQYQEKANSKAKEMQEFVEQTNNLKVGANEQIGKSNSDSESEEEEMESIEVQVDDHNWDCESILSTYSTTKNQPLTVYLPSKKPIKLVSRNQIPDDVAEESQTKEEEGKDNQQKSLPQIVRDRNESKEEKAARKRLVKDFRKERRQQKSQTKEFFKDEQLRIKKQLISNNENFIGAVHLQ